MSWLRDLIDGSHSSLDVLPVPCLCEFLITSYQEKKVLGASGGGKHDSSEADGAPSHRSHFKRRQRTKEKVSVGERQRQRIIIYYYCYYYYFRLIINMIK